MNGFNEEFFEMKEYISSELANEGLQNIHENLKSAILNEFAAKVEHYNITNDTVLTSDSIEYQKILLETIKYILENNKDVKFPPVEAYDVVEDDYSEQSDAEMHM